jgi:hypothetical protein
MADICLVCNKKIGAFSALSFVEVRDNRVAIHFDCLTKFNRSNGVASDDADQVKSGTTRSFESPAAIEVTSTKPSIIVVLSALGWCLFVIMALGGLFFINQDDGGIFGMSVIIAGVFQLSIFLGFSAIIDQLYKINVNTSLSAKDD